jgi:rod shape determining protein RodA
VWDSKIWFKIDYLSLLLMLSLVTVGILAIAGATTAEYTVDVIRDKPLWVKQIAWALLGLVFLAGVVWVDYRLLIKYAPLLYILGIIGLILCYIPLFSHVSHGARSWVKLGIGPQIQTSEIAKLTTLLMLARFLSNRKAQWNGLQDVIIPLAIGAVPAVLILAQPDLGTAVVFIPMTLIMMYAAGLPHSYLLLLLAPASCIMAIIPGVIPFLIWISLIFSLLLSIAYFRVPWSIWLPALTVTILAYAAIYNYGPVMWEHVPEHQKNRIIGYMNPEFDPRNTNYHIIQSKIALGSGGFWGKGLGEGTQGILKFLPEFQHDFVFPIWGEQAGFVGGTILLVLFLLLLMRGIDTALHTRVMQGALIAVGVVSLFFAHILINVGMVTGLLPVTGLPLTFISYGGSFMVCSMMAVGLIMNVRLRNSVDLIKERFGSNRPAMELPKTISDDIWE